MGVLGYMVLSVELHSGKCWLTWCGVGLHGGECCVALCGVLVYMVGVLSYMVESVELHGGVLGYMVGFGIYVGVLSCMVGIVGLHCRGVLGYIVGCWVTCWWDGGLHGRVLG